jgi:hypothetical protein
MGTHKLGVEKHLPCIFAVGLWILPHCRRNHDHDQRCAEGGMSAPIQQEEPEKSQGQPEQDCAWCKIMQQKVCKKQFVVSVSAASGALHAPSGFLSLGWKAWLGSIAANSPTQPHTAPSSISCVHGVDHPGRCRGWLTMCNVRRCRWCAQCDRPLMPAWRACRAAKRRRMHACRW